MQTKPCKLSKLALLIVPPSIDLTIISQYNGMTSTSGALLHTLAFKCSHLFWCQYIFFTINTSLAPMTLAPLSKQCRRMSKNDQALMQTHMSSLGVPLERPLVSNYFSKTLVSGNKKSLHWKAHHLHLWPWCDPHHRWFGLSSDLLMLSLKQEMLHSVCFHDQADHTFLVPRWIPANMLLKQWLPSPEGKGLTGFCHLIKCRYSNKLLCKHSVVQLHSFQAPINVNGEAFNFWL